MAVKTMKPTLGDLLKWEQNPAFSRETITIPSGTGALDLGTVLGRKRVAGTVTVAAAVAQAGNTGNGTLTLANPAYGANVKEGNYRLVCIEPATNAGTFAVEDPNGVVVGTAVVGVAFTGEIRFTIADGTTDFIAGDSFTVPVTIAGADGDLVPWNPNAVDGSEVVAGVLLFDIDATSAAVKTVMVARGAMLSKAALIYGAGVTTDEQKVNAVAALGALGIPARDAA